VAGSLAGDVLQSLAAPIIEQYVAQVPAQYQGALRNALNEVVATAGGAAGGALAGGGSSGALAGAGSAANNEVYNRQLNTSERQWATNNAAAFAKYYEQTTGQTITAAQAEQMLLANGYIDVDAKAAAGGLGYNATAAQYISANSNGLFRATTADYNNPFANGLSNGLSPEQRAMPGAVPNPALGLGIAGVLSAGALLPALAAIPGAPILGVNGAMGSSALASSLGVGGIAGAINATSQYIQTGSVNPIDVAFAAVAGSVAGAIGQTCGLLCNIGINSATGAADTYTNNKISNTNNSILTGAAVNGAAAGLGYGIGMAFQTGMTKLAISAMNGYSWAGTGVWAGQAGTNLFNPNNLPVIGAAVGGSVGSEIGTAVINYGKNKVGK
jgi:filamentous hemagglutinin